jgi:carboxylate-amine ligase
MIELSTHPSFDGERLVPATSTCGPSSSPARASQVAPAALSRVAPPGSMVVNSSRGGGSKDTWLLGRD